MTHFASSQSFALRGAVVLCLLFAAGLGPSRADAQAEDAARTASARALFDEGVGLADQGHWQEAADRFRRALAVRDSAVIAYNLASALQETGQLVEASELLRRVKNDAAADAELRTSASNALAELEPRIGKLSVHVQGQESGDKVMLDARELLPAELDVALPIDPGTHSVHVERNGQSIAEQQVEVAVGQSQQVNVVVQTAAPTPHAVAVQATPAPQEHARTEADETPVTGRWWFWAGVGTAAVGVAVVAIVLAGGSSGDKPEPAKGDFEPGVVGVEVGR